MRFFALQMDIGQLKEQFILQDEKEILVTTRHGLIFFVSLLKGTAIVLLLWLALAVAFVFAGSAILRLIIGVLTVIGAVFELYIILNAYIDWRFNILIVTNQKLVIIDHTSLFYQNVTPIHMNSLNNVTCESQFFGIWRCGILHINLRQTVGEGASREIFLPYLPRPDVVASAIEQSMSIEKNKARETPQEQLPKIEEMQQKVEEEMPETTAVPPAPPAQNG